MLQILKKLVVADPLLLAFTGSAGLVCVNAILQSTALGAIGFGLWTTTATLRIAPLLAPRTSRLAACLLASLLTGSGLTAVALALYFATSVTTLTVTGAFVLLTLALLHLPSAPPPSLHLVLPTITNWRRPVFIALCQLVVLSFLILARTNEPLISPWSILPWSIFPFFFLSCVLTIAHQRQSKSAALWLAMGNVFLAVATSTIIYGVGFGFDPFIHRAAETALVNDGFILPRTPLYSAQYALVGFLHFLTRISVATLDVWLVPLFASVFLPLAAYLGLRDGWGIPERIARTGWIFTLFIPFMLFTFTVPFTMTYVMGMAAFFLFPLAAKQRLVGILLTTMGTLLVFFHPLLGIPVFLLFAGAASRTFASTSRQNASHSLLLFSGVAAGVPALLVLYQYGAGTEVHLSGLIFNLNHFLSLFVNPFGPWNSAVIWPLNALYVLRYWQPVLLALAAPMLALVLHRQFRTPIRLLSLFFSGLFFCILLTSTLFTFKGIIAHEQHEFALRLLQTLYIVPVPLLAVALVKLPARLQMLALACTCLFATTSWYFSYPQFNAKFAYYSPSVSAYDLQTVETIDTASNDKPYIVLSNQMTSAAALQELGFAHYRTLNKEEVLWYAIPTGGPLYTYYLELLTGPNPAQTIDRLFASSDAQYVYFVIHSYWPLNPQRASELEVQSTQMFNVHDRVTIYQFSRYAIENQSQNKE